MLQAVQEFVRAHAERLVLTADGLQREFFVSFVNVPSITKLRHLMARHLGQLVCFAGAQLLRTYTFPLHPSFCCCQFPSAHQILRWVL